MAIRIEWSETQDGNPFIPPFWFIHLYSKLNEVSPSDTFRQVGV
jgi:hypothetical protein